MAAPMGAKLIRLDAWDDWTVPRMRLVSLVAKRENLVRSYLIAVVARSGLGMFTGCVAC